MLTLFQESAHALLLVGGLEAAAEQLLLDDHGVVHLCLQALIDGLLAGANGDGGVLGDGGGQLLRGGHQLLQGINGIHQADAQSLVSLDILGGIDKLLCHAGAHQTGQALGAAEAGGDAQARLGLAKDGGIGANTNVTAHAQLTAAAQSEAVDRGDGGNGQGLQLAEYIVTLFAEGLTLDLGEGAHFGDVGAGHEGLLAAARKHQGTDLFIRIDQIQQLVQILQDLRVQGVEGLGAVDSGHGNAALFF